MNGALIICRFCEKTVAKNELWDHIAVDIGYRPFDCATCAQTFVNKAELTEHEFKNGGHKGNYVRKFNKIFLFFHGICSFLRLTISSFYRFML